MKSLYAALLASAICIIAALVEGLCAGRNVKSFFASLKSPRYSPPLWLWSNHRWRLLHHLLVFTLSTVPAVSGFCRQDHSPHADRVHDDRECPRQLHNFSRPQIVPKLMVGNAFPVLDIALFTCLIRLDELAAWSMIPYLLYRIYAVWWGYRIWKANEAAAA